VIALVMIFFWVPETKQRTLEELDYIFAVPTRTHMRYQMTKALPYFINRWIFRRRDAVLEPLYHLDKVQPRDDLDTDEVLANKSHLELSVGNEISTVTDEAVDDKRVA
jgi:hypothetical protein